MQAPWSGRRAPSTVAVGDEPPMNSHETREAVGLLGLPGQPPHRRASKG